MTVWRTLIGAEGVSPLPAGCPRARLTTRPRRGGDEWPRNKTMSFITKPYTVLQRESCGRAGGEGRGEGVASSFGAAVRAAGGGW